MCVCIIPSISPSPLLIMGPPATLSAAAPHRANRASPPTPSATTWRRLRSRRAKGDDAPTGRQTNGKTDEGIGRRRSRGQPAAALSQPGDILLSPAPVTSTARGRPACTEAVSRALVGARGGGSGRLAPARRSLAGGSPDRSWPGRTKHVFVMRAASRLPRGGNNE